MTVSVLLFASYADAFGARSVPVTVQAPITLADLVSALRALPGGDVLPSSPVIAVNRVYVRDHSLTISAVDEIAVIPPVAGG